MYINIIMCTVMATDAVGLLVLCIDDNSTWDL